MIYSQIKTGGKIIAVAPGSVWKTKRWPVEYFKKIIFLLKENNNIILIGGKNDQGLCEELTSGDVINLAGKLSILESAAAISFSRVIVTNDSAPLHIASAMNIPTVAIFGATVPRFGFYPLADNSIVLENSGINCRPCGRHGGSKCWKKHFKCMKEVHPERVIEEALKRM